MDTLLYEMQEGVATITLNRPDALNALNARMAEELVQALLAVAADAGVRAVVLQGAGGAFCAGGDVRDSAAAGPRTAAEARAGMERYRVLTKTLYELDRPVVAAADGVAFGAGFSLLLLADIVLLSTRARLCMAFGRIGLVPDCGALFTLPRAVGLQRARELILSAREIGADEARAMGLALEVLPPEALAARARALARALCEASDTATPLAKRALQQSLQSDLDSMLALEGASQAIALASPYLADAAQRFARKAPRRFVWPAG